MLDQAVPAQEWRPWYHRGRFPVLPRITTRAADKWNTFAWRFYWLGLVVWSLDSFGFRIEFELDDEGIRVGALLPYLRIVLWLLPFPHSWHQKLWRKPEGCK